MKLMMNWKSSEYRNDVDGARQGEGGETCGSEGPYGRNSEVWWGVVNEDEEDTVKAFLFKPICW